MDFFEKLGETITERGKEAADKAKDLAEIARLKSQISTCEEVIRKNYMEIGRLYYEKYAHRTKDEEGSAAAGTPEAGTAKEAGAEPARPEPHRERQLFEKQCRSIENAQKGVEELQQKIREIKGL